MEQNFIPLMIVVAVIAILITVFITRWLFRIDIMVKHQQVLIALLVKICRKQGVTDEELNVIKNTFNMK